MMFGAGIGIATLNYATAELIYYFFENPDVITGNTMASGAYNVMEVIKWSFSHWHFSGLWLCAVCSQCPIFRCMGLYFEPTDVH